MLWLIQRDFLEGKTVGQMVSEALSEVPNPTRNVGHCPGSYPPQ